MGNAAFTNAYGILVNEPTNAGTNYALVTQGGLVIFNNNGTAAGDFTVKSDSYDALFVDASDNAAVLMNNSAGKLAFFGATPIVRTGAYTITNGATDRAYDANATSTAELADVLYTLISDLKNYGLLQ
jgi:hypothetical protein